MKLPYKECVKTDCNFCEILSKCSIWCNNSIGEKQIILLFIMLFIVENIYYVFNVLLNLFLEAEYQLHHV